MDDINRMRAIEREREEKKKTFEQRKEALKNDASSGLKKIGTFIFATPVQRTRLLHGFSPISTVADQMFSTTTNAIENQFKEATIGLVSAADYAKTRAELEQKRDQQLASIKQELKQQKKAETVVKKAVLSFDLDEEESEEVPVPKRPKVSKNPDIDTSFLPDRYT
jgi:hypothetical protein